MIPGICLSVAVVGMIRGIVVMLMGKPRNDSNEGSIFSVSLSSQVKRGWIYRFLGIIPDKF
jgi:hypothetical protein